ncbi:MAG TPA: DUF1080 domain-containing protein [Planctomycetota bacterium]|nr:DUF1080 domain-containing protein [Planctomycetota bacterium]
MRSIRRIAIVSLFWLATAFAADNTPPEGFTALFNGKDLSGWKAPEGDNGHWKVVDGVIDYDGKSEAKTPEKHLWTEKEYGDITLQIDWKWTGKPYKIKHPIIQPDGTYKKDEKGVVIQQEIDEAGDSGVYLRGNDKSQVNIWCWNTGSGEVYGYRTDPKLSAEVHAGVTPKKKMDKPYGEWNHMEITIKGDRLTVNLNGEEVISNAQLPGVPAKGKLALQHHYAGGDKYSPIQFKNIYVKELK